MKKYEDSSKYAVCQNRRLAIILDICIYVPLRLVFYWGFKEPGIVKDDHFFMLSFWSKNWQQVLPYLDLCQLGLAQHPSWGQEGTKWQKMD